jgi:phage shock protein PspC (stress-responsive transcriptional regulator)
MLGGVCAGLADRLGVDPVLVRLAAVFVGILSGGLALVTYLAAWVLIPPAGAQTVPEPTGRRPEPAAASPYDVDTREAWTAVGGELRTLVDTLRKPRPEQEPIPDRVRSPLQAADRVATVAGVRLRTPEVRDSARRLATSLSTAVGGTVDDLGRRSRRTDHS